MKEAGSGPTDPGRLHGTLLSWDIGKPLGIPRLSDAYNVRSTDSRPVDQDRQNRQVVDNKVVSAVGIEPTTYAD
jgi:hypothetical protein